MSKNQMQAAGPGRDSKSGALMRAILYNKSDMRLGVTRVSDEVDYIAYGGVLFMRGEWLESEAAYIFDQCEAPVTFHTDKLDND